MYSEERRAEIRNIIGQKGSIEVNTLAELFQTSRETIRRDLSDLERQGALRRTHGGAMLDPFLTSPPESPVGERGVRQMEEKKLICRKAAGFICSNDTIFIDNSSTMIYLPQYIPADMHITIITNSISFLYETSKVNNYNWLLICLGGIFKPQNLSVHGSDTLKNAEPYYPAKTFISCAGISPVNKIADASPHEIEVKKMMINRAQEVFLLADHTKFEKAGQVFLCDFDAVDHIITGPAFAGPEGGGDFLNKTNIHLVMADGA